MTMFISIIAAGCFLYVIGTLVLFIALGKFSGIKSEWLPFVTVVIAAHNERSSIGSCLASIVSQNYPSGKFEVIVADDRSTDGTTEVIARFQSIMPYLKTIRIESVSPGVSPKKNALSHAIASARGDIILQTDADCIVPHSWLSGMSGGFGEETGMVIGLSPYVPDSGFLNSFIRHEYLWNAALSIGSNVLGFGTHATGRNLAFRRNLFEKVNGYGDGIGVLSGDDTLLLQRMRNLTRMKVKAVTDPSTHVLTRAPGSFSVFLRQRIRHMSTGKRFDPVLIAAGVAIYGFHILLLFALILSFVSWTAFIGFLISFSVKMMVDACIARKTKKVTSLEVQWKGFFVNEVLLLLYMAIVPLLGLFVPVRWK